jgi:hypothetical protein
MMRFVAVAALVLFAGCTDTERAAFGAYGDPAEIVLYSGGAEVGRWCSTGKIEDANGSDGYLFKDKKTQRLVQVSGDIVLNVRAPVCAK